MFSKFLLSAMMVCASVHAEYNPRADVQSAITFFDELRTSGANPGIRAEIQQLGRGFTVPGTTQATILSRTCPDASDCTLSVLVTTPFSAPRTRHQKIRTIAGIVEVNANRAELIRFVSQAEVAEIRSKFPTSLDVSTDRFITMTVTGNKAKEIWDGLTIVSVLAPNAHAHKKYKHVFCAEETTRSPSDRTRLVKRYWCNFQYDLNGTAREYP